MQNHGRRQSMENDPSSEDTLADPKNKGVALLLYSVLWFDFQH